jgi:hypothetical protein
VRTLSKKNFAVLRNVTPARVSQWIRAGQIGADALVGTGRRARIDIELATEHLRGRLDVVQRLANGSAQLDEMPAHSGLDEDFKRERLEGLQRQNRRLAAEEIARAGRYVDGQAARAELAKVAGRVVSIFDGELPEMAAAVAAKFDVAQQDVLQVLRGAFRNACQRGTVAEAEPT